jgi:hypothetical protein
MSVEEAKRQAELEAEARRRGLEPWQLAAMRAVPVDLVRDLVADSRRGPSQPSSMVTKPEAPAAPKGNGWAEPTPLGPPPGVALIDRMVDVQDGIDRAARERELARAGLREKANGDDQRGTESADRR